MRLGLLLATASAIAATPAVALLLLAATGAAAAGPALVGVLAVALASVLLALLWAHDMERLAEAVRYALRGEQSRPRPCRGGRAAAAGAARSARDRAAGAHAGGARGAGRPGAARHRGDHRPPARPAAGARRRPRRAPRQRRRPRRVRRTTSPPCCAIPACAAPSTAPSRRGRRRSPTSACSVPVARELQATVLPLDPPLPDGGAGDRGAVGPLARARGGAHARRLRRQCQPRTAHAAGQPDRLHRRRCKARPPTIRRRSNASSASWPSRRSA